MRLLLIDRNPELVEAWKAEYWPPLTRIDHVPTIIDHIKYYDAIVSPANSFGFMDGGIDLVYSAFFGWQLQDKVQAEIKYRASGELIVGQAMAVPTGHEKCKFLVCAPTMRVPMDISNTINVYLATRAAIRALKSIGFEGEVVFPGMGTGCGKVPPKLAAYQMSLGVHDGLREREFPRNLHQASFDHQVLMTTGPI